MPEDSAMESEPTAFYYSEPQIELTENLDHASADNMELPADLDRHNDPHAQPIEVLIIYLIN